MGECARDNDLEVNPVREKKLTNIRTVNADEKVRPPAPACSIVGSQISHAHMHVAVLLPCRGSRDDSMRCCCRHT